MTYSGSIIAALLLGTIMLDLLVRPRPVRGTSRSLAGAVLMCCLALMLFGGFLALTGGMLVAAAMTLGLQAALVVASNAKHVVLGEPLLFTDLALVGAIVRHPQFYWSAVPLWQRWVAAFAAAALLTLLAWLFVPDPLMHLAGLLLTGATAALLSLVLRSAWMRDLAPVPDAAGDVARHGLQPTMLLHWRRWRSSTDPAAPAPIAALGPDEPALIVIVQCESFADPVDLFGDPALALPALTRARADAVQWGRLHVSGFGAYTMRSEYGVLWGREEEALGFRRYDPFLTAIREAEHALPRRLSGWRSLFLHPHDLRFYNRHRIMPAGGFAELLGPERFAAPQSGRYVTDAAIADTILQQAGAAAGPTLIYAVTIENHGPWAPEDGVAGGDLRQSYLRLVRRGDAMLAQLREGISALRKPALLVFFGDHRPSIPGVTHPGGDRHTPYVMLRFDKDGQVQPGGSGAADLTPAGLHHAVLAQVSGSAD
ncbi:LTA synthase family protein [Croceibacterium sp. TMG7-5b_MA50]|uniref:LTA synthase family protein n=1 Tax=Croceibacterium sp. TMG7-5b_MA50 TaxID=3121290 RepID=UPI003221D513